MSKQTVSLEDLLLPPQTGPAVLFKTHSVEDAAMCLCKMDARELLKASACPEHPAPSPFPSDRLIRGLRRVS